MSFVHAHRGPFNLQVVRPAKKPGCFTSEMLPGLVDSTDVEAEARALLSDPRDTITSVFVWCPHDECFCGGYTK